MKNRVEDDGENVEEYLSIISAKTKITFIPQFIPIYIPRIFSGNS